MKTQHAHKTIEVNATLTMYALDDKVSWQLNNCWLSETHFFAKTTTLATTTKAAAKKPSGEPFHSVTYNDADSLDSDYYEDDYTSSLEYAIENESENLLHVERDSSSSKPLVVVSSSPRDPAQNVNFKVSYLKNRFRLSSEGRVYALDVNMLVKFVNLTQINSSTINKMYILCNLRPMLSCDHKMGHAKCAKNSVAEDYFAALSGDLSQKMKTVVLAQLDVDKKSTSLAKNFVYHTNTANSFVRPVSEDDSNNDVPKSHLSTGTRKTPPPYDKDELGPTIQVSQNTDSIVGGDQQQHAPEFSFIGWLDENKVTIVLAFIILVSAFVFCVMLKLVNRNLNCKFTKKYFNIRSEL